MGRGWILLNLNLQSSAGYFEWKYPTLLTAVSAAAWAVVLYANRGRRRFALGAAAGLACALLIEGLCFAAKR